MATVDVIGLKSHNISRLDSLHAAAAAAAAALAGDDRDSDANDVVALMRDRIHTQYRGVAGLTTQSL